jgi:hypothetical protein
MASDAVMVAVAALAAIHEAMGVVTIDCRHWRLIFFWGGRRVRIRAAYG